MLIDVKKLSKTDNVRRELVNLLVVIVTPLISFLIYRKIVGDEFLSTETGQLILIGIALLSAIAAAVVYECLFPKYKHDIDE